MWPAQLDAALREGAPAPGVEWSAGSRQRGVAGLGLRVSGSFGEGYRGGVRTDAGSTGPSMVQEKRGGLGTLPRVKVV